MVDVNRMTHKLQEALQQAGGLAARRNHQGIDVEHLLARAARPGGRPRREPPRGRRASPRAPSATRSSASSTASRR